MSSLPLVEMRNVDKHFGGIHAVNDVSVDLFAGEVVGILGHNGAGKSALMKVLSGAYPMDGGEIRINGEKVAIHNPRDAGRRLKADLEIVLNTVPFGAQDFDNAQEKAFGQRFEDLAAVVDVFEVMTYHQILKRPPGWISRIGDEVKARSGRTTVCTLQAVPLYLDGLHAHEARSPSLSIDEFRESVDAARGSTVDGVVFFLWSDFLNQVLVDKDSRRLDVIRAARRA